MTNLTKYGKGCSPSAIQRKYSLTYEQGHELAERLKKTQELEKENAKIKEQVNHLLKTQARQFVDNQKLQVKAEKAKDVLNIDTARQIKQLKELLKECVPYVNHRFLETKETLTKPYTALYKVSHKKAEKLLTKINEVLK